MPDSSTLEAADDRSTSRARGCGRCVLRRDRSPRALDARDDAVAVHRLIQVAARDEDVAGHAFDRPVRDDEAEAARMGLDPADDQVHAVGQAETVAARLNQVAGLDEPLEQAFQRGALFAGDLQPLHQFAGGGRVLDPVADGGQQLFAIQHCDCILLFPTASAVSTLYRPCDRHGARRSDPDLELVRRAQAGDVEAFGELVERNRRAVFRAALAAVGSPTEADDVAQEAFVTAFQKLDGLSRRVVVQDLAAVDHVAQGDRPAEERHAVDAAAGRAGATARAARSGIRCERLPSGGRSQEDDLLTSDLQRRLRPLIAALPKKLRDALLLAGSGDHSYEEIGQMLKIPVGTVKWRVSEARKVLKQKMAAMGYDDV